MLGAGFQLQRAQSEVSNGRSIHTKKLHVSEDSSSNVERFLESVTPSVPAHYLSKVCFQHFQVNTFFSLFGFVYVMSSFSFCLQTIVRERRGLDVDSQHPYFVLGDVWESFAEWSAYGIGVPLTLYNKNKDQVFQYYVPSLSGIQIYADSDPLSSSSLQAR